jgi:hypothetical protein
VLASHCCNSSLTFSCSAEGGPESPPGAEDTQESSATPVQEDRGGPSGVPTGNNPDSIPQEGASPQLENSADVPDPDRDFLSMSDQQQEEFVDSMLEDQ